MLIFSRSEPNDASKKNAYTKNCVYSKHLKPDVLRVSQEFRKNISKICQGRLKGIQRMFLKMFFWVF